jgi:hypothetical protein
VIVTDDEEANGGRMDGISEKERNIFGKQHFYDEMQIIL